MTRRISCIPLLFAAALVGWIAPGCGEEKSETTIAVQPVMAVPVEIRNVADQIEATGQLLAKAEARVAAQVSGQVTSIAEGEGAAVEVDQVVLEIDPERRTLELANQRGQVAQARAQLEESRRSLGRVKKLYARNAVSQAQLDESETALQLSQSRLQSASAQLGLAERAVEDSTVKAPFAGLIARRHVNAGEFVSAGQPLFELVALDPIEVEFFLPEADSSRVRIGVPVAVQVSPFPEERFDGQVTVISPTIDQDTRTLRVKAAIDNRDGRLRPGLFARVDLGISKRSGVTMVPEDAILQRADGSVLFLMDGTDRVRRLRVATGAYLDTLVEVVGGIKADDLVVVRGQAELLNGSRVSLRNADGSPAGPPTKTVDSRPPSPQDTEKTGAGG